MRRLTFDMRAEERDERVPRRKSCKKSNSELSLTPELGRSPRRPIDDQCCAGCDLENETILHERAARTAVRTTGDITE